MSWQIDGIDEWTNFSILFASVVVAMGDWLDCDREKLTNLIFIIYFDHLYHGRWLNHFRHRIPVLIIPVGGGGVVSISIQSTFEGIVGHFMWWQWHRWNVSLNIYIFRQRTMRECIEQVQKTSKTNPESYSIVLYYFFNLIQLWPHCVSSCHIIFTSIIIIALLCAVNYRHIQINRQ